MDKIENARKAFEIFAESKCKGFSDLYYQLSLEISRDDELLKLALNSRNRQPVPNLFLATIHYLLLKFPEESLAQYYPSVSKISSKRIPIDLVKKFCFDRRDHLLELIQTRIVQTNAINRTAYLMPIISSLTQEHSEVSLIDVGSSSGLNLNFDQYEFSFGSNIKFGNSPVKIESKILHGQLPPFEKMAQIVRKIGIDQNPLDLNKEDQALWLKSLIWPDQRFRFERLEAAIELARNSNIELIRAREVQDFKETIKKIPRAEHLVVYHTHALYQFTREERAIFRKMLDEIGKSRDFTYLAVEADVVFDREDYLGKGVMLELTKYQENKKHTEILGTTHVHGYWIKWKDK